MNIKLRWKNIVIIKKTHKNLDYQQQCIFFLKKLGTNLVAKEF
jgi:hypothetical protein